MIQMFIRGVNYLFWTILCFVHVSCDNQKINDCQSIYNELFSDFIEEIHEFGFGDFNHGFDTFIDIQDNTLYINDLKENHPISMNYEVLECDDARTSFNINAKRIAENEVKLGNFKYAVGFSDIIIDRENNIYFFKITMLCGKMCGYIYLYEFNVENEKIEIINSSFSVI